MYTILNFVFQFIKNTVKSGTLGKRILLIARLLKQNDISLQ